MKFRFVVLARTVAAALPAASTALAAPVAPHPPLSKLGKRMLAAQPGKKVERCPDAAVVAPPVYPGSLCVANASISGNGVKDLPLLSLVSKASPEDVRGWYAKQLSSWKYDPKLHHFVHPDRTADRMLDEPEVHVAKATDQNLALFKLGYDLAGMHTLIQIRYEPQK